MSDPTTARVLRTAKALIDTPQKWGQGSRRNRLETLCMSEAVLQAARDLSVSYRPAMQLLKTATGAIVIPAWNDTHTFEEVHERFDQAIRLAEAS